MKRFLLISLVFILALAVYPAQAASKSDYPQKAVTIINPNAAGGGTDLVIRTVTLLAEPFFGQPLRVVNKPGGSQAIGTMEAAQSKPDGYTLLVSDKSLASSYYLGVGQVTWTDFESVCRLDIASHVILVSASSPYKTAKDLADAAKAAPNTLTIGVSGIGGMSHLVSEAFIASSGAPIKVVGFNDGASNKAAVTGQQVTASALQLAEAYPLVKSGDLRIIGLAEEARSPYFPDIPTFKEQGINCVLNQFRGIWAPKGTPKEIVAKLAEAFKQAMETDKFKQFQQDSFTINGYLAPEDFVKEMQSQDAFLKGLVKAAGLLKKE